MRAECGAGNRTQSHADTLRALALTVLCVGGLAQCRLSAPSETDPILEQEVLARLESYYSDFSARDWPAFASHFWPAATITTAWQPPGEDGIRVVPTPVEMFVEQAPHGPGSRKVFAEWMLDATVTAQGGIAQAWVRYGARFGDPGDIQEWEGIDVFSLIRLDGTWRIASLVFMSAE